MNQQLTQRPEPLPFRVIISRIRGLNIILSNRRIENERTYSHFVTLEQAEEFAANLETALSSVYYTCLDHCFLCGQPFTRTEDVCVLTNNREAHLKCFYTAVRKKQLSFADKKDGCYIYFPYGTPGYDFNNLDDKNREFRYAIQVVSQKVVHLWMQEAWHHPKHHFCLTHDECQRMIHEIREKAEMVRCAEIGTCFCCGKSVYVDEDRFTMTSGELIHSRCMERLVTGELAAKVSFPATRTRRYDVFGFGERHNANVNGLYPFPME